MDNHSASESVPAPYHRLVKNMTGTNNTGSSRLPGWKRFGEFNADLHDQLVGLAQGYESFSYRSDQVYDISGYTYQDYHAAYQGYDVYNGSVYYPSTGEFVYTYDITQGYEYSVCGDELEYRPYCSYSFPQTGAREAITLIEEFPSGEGTRHLIAATESRIYALNDASHNWRIIADGKAAGGSCGCGTRRFHSARLGNYMLFTNNYDDVLAWPFDEPSSGCELQAAQEISDLVSLQIRKASVIVEYKGFIFLMNVEVEGIRYVAKTVWSDFGNPLSWAPSNASLASDSNIGDPSEAVVEAKVLGDYLFIYKERSIWRCTLVDPAEGLFSFQQVYRGEHVPRYRNSLVSTGDAHYYFGPDEVYLFDLYGQSPKVVEWIQKATRMVFDDNLVFSSENLGCGIEKAKCDLAVGGWDPVNQNLWFSWVSKKNGDGTSVAETTKTGFIPKHGVDCPNRSLVFNLRHQTSSYVDHGFSAFGPYRPESRLSLREWLVELGACTEADLPADIKEGEAFAAMDPGTPINSIINATEDPSLPSDPDSLCAALGDSTFDDLCYDCGADTKFLMASTADFCIKQYDQDVSAREFYDFTSGLYSDLGYDSVLESAALGFATDFEKTMNRVTVEFSPPVQTPTPNLYCKLGNSSQPECALWWALQPQPLKCQTAATQGGTVRPWDKARFHRLVRGRFLFYRVYVTGTCGPVDFSKIELMVRRSEG